MPLNPFSGEFMAESGAAVAEIMLNRVLDALEANPAVAPIAEAYLVAGELAWDDCCGILAAAPLRTFNTVTFPTPVTDATNCDNSLLAVELAIVLLRCAPSVDDMGNPPTPQAMTDAFTSIMGDAAVIYNAVTTGLPEGWERALVEQSFDGADGGCIAIDTRLTIGLPQSYFCQDDLPVFPEIVAGPGVTFLRDTNNLSDVADAAEALSNLGGQPLDADLTAIAALETTAFGRGVLEWADSAAGRAALSVYSVAQVDALLTALSDAVAAAYQPLNANLTAIAALTTTAFGRAVLEWADSAAGRAALSVYSTSEADSAIAAALAALVDSSPAALDTLNELAAALGDDPNFATTVTNALANKQPLDADLTALAAAGNSAVLAALTAAVTTPPVGMAITDESTAIAATGTLTTFRMPYAMTLGEVRISLTGACATGTFTVDINQNGASVLSTKLTVDATEKTSTTATVAAVISTAALTDDAEITVDVDDVGDGTATGLKLWLIPA